MDQVYVFLDGELDDGECANVREHLEDCPDCLREYGLVQAVKRLVQKHCGCSPAPADLHDRVLARIRTIASADLEIAQGPSC